MSKLAEEEREQEWLSLVTGPMSLLWCGCRSGDRDWPPLGAASMPA